MLYCSRGDCMHSIRRFNEYFLGDTKFDLRPISFGERQCTPNYKRSVEINVNYMIHYIADGKGVFRMGENEYPLSQGQIFITKPNDVFGFQADAQDPWHFIWIKFSGSFAKKLNDLPTVLNIDGTPFTNMLAHNPESNTLEEYITAQLYLIFSMLFESKKRHDYVTIIKNYVRSRPSMDKVSVEEIRQFVNLNRQYMSTMFRRATGMSVQQYIIQARVERAQLLLERGYSIAETAEHCGYASIYAFSKCFKKSTGIAPSEYKKQNGYS